jgi:hypothetical protein
MEGSGSRRPKNIRIRNTAFNFIWRVFSTPVLKFFLYFQQPEVTEEQAHYGDAAPPHEHAPTKGENTCRRVPRSILSRIGQVSIKIPNHKCRLCGRCLRSHPLLGFFGAVKQFGRFGFWSNTQCMYYSWICSPHNLIPSPPVTHCIECINLYFFTHGRGEGGKLERK